jgi:hypothetical protein
MRKPLTANLSLESESLKNSARFRSRTDLGKELPTETDSSTKQELFGCNADGQILAAFGPSAFDDHTPILGGHPYQKTVGPLA